MQISLLLAGAAALGLFVVGLVSGGGPALWQYLLLATGIFWLAAAIDSAGAKRRRITSRVVRLLVLSALSFSLAALGAWIMPTDGSGGIALRLVLYAGYAFLLIAVLYDRTKRPRKGYCIACEYDLTGNVSGRCPECGTPVAAGAAPPGPPGPAEVKKPE